ncbi:uncharacterized protein [Argopecten irradians]|uniref:uncharacterized protein isoform X1 n=1 Tax=Argopecten irradians TaxID=31199 RepID=UPI00371F45A2
MSYGGRRPSGSYPRRQVPPLSPTLRPTYAEPNVPRREPVIPPSVAEKYADGATYRRHRIKTVSPVDQSLYNISDLSKKVISPSVSEKYTDGATYLRHRTSVDENLYDISDLTKKVPPVIPPSVAEKYADGATYRRHRTKPVSPVDPSLYDFSHMSTKLPAIRPPARGKECYAPDSNRPGQGRCSQRSRTLGGAVGFKSSSGVRRY